MFHRKGQPRLPVACPSIGRTGQRSRQRNRRREPVRHQRTSHNETGRKLTAVFANNANWNKTRDRTYAAQFRRRSGSVCEPSRPANLSQARPAPSASAADNVFFNLSSRPRSSRRPDAERTKHRPAMRQAFSVGPGTATAGRRRFRAAAHWPGDTRADSGPRDDNRPKMR